MIGLLTAVLILAQLCDDEGLFQACGAGLARFAAGRPRADTYGGLVLVRSAEDPQRAGRRFAGVLATLRPALIAARFLFIALSLKMGTRGWGTDLAGTPTAPPG